MSIAVPTQAVAHYPFDLDRCVVVDLETFPGRWCAGFRGLARDGVIKNWIVDRSRESLAKMLAFIANNRRILVSYNGDHFDVPVMRAILGGFDPYGVGQTIITQGRQAIPLANLPALGCDHIDLAARLRRGGGFPGLKKVAAYLGRPRLRELPYPPGSILSDEHWAEVIAYNGLDLEHTQAVLERFSPELQSLAVLSEEMDQDLRSTPTPRVVERVFLSAYWKAHGADPSLPATPQEVLYRGVPGVVRPQTAEAAAWHDAVVGRPLPMIGLGDRVRPEVPKARFKIGKLEVSVGSGGLHSVDSPRVYYSTRNAMLISVDVGSYYPSLIAAKSIAPRAYGDTGAATYRRILERRLEVKRLAKTSPDPAERKRLDIQANALKLVLNSTFGKLGDPHSTLFDPAAFLAVTLTGQLMLVDLIERLTAVGVRVLSANTDGLFVKVRRKNRRWQKVLKQWEADTEMVLDVDPLKRLAILASNRFAVLDQSGKVKRKGAGVKGDLSPMAAPNALVVADAVVDALLEDIPPERTIRQCTDPVRFCSVTQRTGKVRAAVLLDETDGCEVELPKIARWYRAYESHCRIVHRFDGGRHTTPSNAIGVNLSLDLVDGTLPGDLDYGWYIGQARKTIQEVPGYRHRSLKRLQGHPVALDMLGRGLVPAPKRQKAQLKGSNRAVPTFLWDWAEHSTFGTFTGPKAGIFVLDVDEPAKFKTWVDKNNSPLLENRWRDLDGCLVACHGSATPEQVRTGKARGKLIFRLDGDESHPLAKIAQNHWAKAKGVEVFYGQGIPSLVGKHPDGSDYRLDGTMGEAPSWLINGLSPTKKPVAPKVDGVLVLARPRPEPGTNGHAQPAEVDRALLEGLPKDLASLSPELGKRGVGWHSKDLGEGRTIWVGRCPFAHASGQSTDADLSAGYNLDGFPFVRCMHASCHEIPAIDKLLKDAFRPQITPAVEFTPLIPTAISIAMSGDLECRRVATHHSPTGAGKSHAVAQVAVMRYREGLATLIAVPTLRLAEETLNRLRDFAPDAFEADAVAIICGHRPMPLNGTADVEAETGDDDDEPGVYPIRKWTRVVICTHAQLGRRGFSKFMRAIWTKLAASDDEDSPRPAFALIVDEVAEFIRACRQEIALAHRVTRKGEPDGSGGRLVPIKDCPKSNRSGNCSNCMRRMQGGEPRFNPYSIRELCSPRQIDVDPQGKELRTARQPLVVTESDATLQEVIKVGHTTFAAKLVAWQGKPIDENTRRTAPLFLFSKGEQGEQPPEPPHEILGHMLEHGFRPVVTWEKPVDEEGKPVDPELLKFRIENPSREGRWDENIVFPTVTCYVPRLRFGDLAGLEMMRRFAREQKVGIVFAGATLVEDDLAVLGEIWPEMVRRFHPYPSRKIRQVAVAFLDNHHGAGSLVDEGKRLVTRSLEEFGKGMVFCSTRVVAKTLYNAVKLDHPSVRLAEENDETMYLKGSLHESEDLQCYITYSRGVLGLGANVLDIRFMVVDALAFRSIASFNPGEVTPEEFERARAEERLALIMQNLGRALRGEQGKTVVLIVLNADDLLKTAIGHSPAILEGSELPPVFGSGTDLPQLIDQARRWLGADGGEWPGKDPGKANTKRAGRPKGSVKRTRESVLATAEVAIHAGMKWRDFARKEHPDRVLSADELAEIKGRFGGTPEVSNDSDPKESS